MKNGQHRLLLQTNLKQLEKASAWLSKSIIQCSNIKLNKKPTEDEFDVLENLTSRFARLSDILVQKVFRLLDTIELEPKGSTLDVINRAAKRGFSDDKTLKNIRELRNAIAHEYTEEELIILFKEVKKFSPLLIEVFNKVMKYCEKYK
jgi:uncharacterized protein YutE (UPF0331/DUF86 family)